MVGLQLEAAQIRRDHVRRAAEVSFDFRSDGVVGNGRAHGKGDVLAPGDRAPDGVSRDLRVLLRRLEGEVAVGVNDGILHERMDVGGDLVVRDGDSDRHRIVRSADQTGQGERPSYGEDLRIVR